MADALLLLAVQPMPITTTILDPSLDLKSLNKLVGFRGSILALLSEVKSDLSVLAKELKLLSQLLYKIHNRFRNDKGYKDIRMFEKSLQKLLAMNFLKSIENYLNFLPSHPTPSPNLPTKEMLRYSCLQLYGVGALLARIDMLAHNSGLLAIQRLSLGHFWGVATHQLACVARIWVLGRHLLQLISSIFRMLRNDVANLLSEMISKFMELIPMCLNTFLPVDILAGTDESVVPVIDSCENKVVDLESFLDIGVPIRRNDKTVVKLVGNNIVPTKLEDKLEGKSDKFVGTHLKSLNQARKKQLKSKTEQSNLNEEGISTRMKSDGLSDIHSIADLKLFLIHETATRKTSKKSCLTRNLSQDSWKKLKVEVLKNINEKIPNKTIKTCRKLIRNRL